jgi:hypothetical protein
MCPAVSCYPSAFLAIFCQRNYGILGAAIKLISFFLVTMQFSPSWSAVRKPLSSFMAFGFGLTSLIALPIGSVAAPAPSLPNSSSPVVPIANATPTPEQIAQINRKLQGVWNFTNGEDDSSSFGVLVSIGPNQEGELFLYHYGRRYQDKKDAQSESLKIKYQIVGIRDVNNLQLVTYEISLISKGETSKPEPLVMAFDNDRALNYYSYNGEAYDKKDLMKSSRIFQKISDSTDPPNRIAFKANSNSLAEGEAANNVLIGIDQEYASGYSPLENPQELSVGNEFYSYQVTNIDKGTVVKAIPKIKALKGYVGMVYRRKGEAVATGVCESIQPRMRALANPTVKIKKSGAAVIQCPKGSKLTLENGKLVGS